MALTLSLTREDLGPRLVLPLLLAGVAGTVLFELISFLSVIISDKSLQPTVLVTKMAKVVLGMDISLNTALMLHFLTGILFYPVLLVVLLLGTRVCSPVYSGLILGVVTWVLAQGVFSPMVGRPFMNGFTFFTWKSLVIHNLYALAVTITLALLLRRMNTR